MSLIHGDCHSNTFIDTFLYIGYVVVFFTFIFMIVDIFAILNPNYVWMTSKFYKKPCLGRDIEDCDPYNISRAGHNLASIAIHETGKLNHMVDQTQISLDQIEDSYEDLD